MYTLVFDTTGQGVVAGIYKDNELLKKIDKSMEFGQAEELAVGIDLMLKELNIGFKDIELLGVCTGPGSFTGVRASIAFARGLAMGNPDVKITGVSAFEVYARMLNDKDRALYNAVIIETKRDDFYFQLFDASLKKISEPMALSREDIAHKLRSHQTSFIGDGVERLFSQSMGLQIKRVELSEMINVDALFDAVYAKYFEKTLDFPKPLYIREANACVK